MNKPIGNGLEPIIAQAIEEIKQEQGESFDLSKINLAELQRRTGISRAKLRRLKENGFVAKPHGLTGHTAAATVLSGYTGMLDNLLRQGVQNAAVCFRRLQEAGYRGSQTSVKRYIRSHKDLVPAKRQLVAPQGSRGLRYNTGPGQVYQMDWGFTKVHDYIGGTYKAACFAMICHHCGERYVEFFPNAKQENLFIGMLHGFEYMGVPQTVLTDNMRSVVNGRDLEGHPLWNKEYEAFMAAVGFQTKLCKPRHPFTKGKVERLVRFVKDNFLAGRTFWNVTDLNQAALEWCNEQNGVYHKAIDCVPQQVHFTSCREHLSTLPVNTTIQSYLAPVRKISFDGFVNYEGRRFGVPYHYAQSMARVMRSKDTLYIYSLDLKRLLVTHEVTWSYRDRFCQDQYVDQPEEFPTAPVQTSIRQLEPPKANISFDKFDFDKEVDWDDD